ncbi:MAG: hypothetical protein LBM12_00300 [Candidatus Nomurabacteria bacterium]|jgi:hypothetical protein|nr:hypothetical protein [Candidatus Nomurabacteria bacterium]
MNRGKIIIDGVRGAKLIICGELPEKHEFDTLYFLRDYCHKVVETVPASKSQGSRTPDIKIDGLFWEMKSPRGTGKYTIEHCLKAASKQCENVILDLRRMNGSYRRYLPKVEREFKGNYRLKRLLVITKAQKTIEFKK